MTGFVWLSDPATNIPFNSTNPFPTNITNANPNGQAVMAQSAPVVLASNQTPIAVNTDSAALISGAGVTTTQTGTDQINASGRGAKVILDMTNAGTGSVTLTVQGKDIASGKYYTLLVGAPVTTNSTNVYEVYPGIPAVANAAAGVALPRTWRVLVTANNANPTTYTVGASVIS